MVTLDRFSGDNSAAWVLQAEQYFAFYNIFPKYQVSIASFYLDGEALDWYRLLFRNQQLASWDNFVDKLLIRFPNRIREVPDLQEVGSEILRRLAELRDALSGYATKSAANSASEQLNLALPIDAKVIATSTHESNFDNSIDKEIGKSPHQGDSDFGKAIHSSEQIEDQMLDENTSLAISGDLSPNAPMKSLMVVNKVLAESSQLDVVTLPLVSTDEEDECLENIGDKVLDICSHGYTCAFLSRATHLSCARTDFLQLAPTLYMLEMDAAISNTKHFIWDNFKEIRGMLDCHVDTTFPTQCGLPDFPFDPGSNQLFDEISPRIRTESLKSFVYKVSSVLSHGYMAWLSRLGVTPFISRFSLLVLNDSYPMLDMIIAQLFFNRVSVSDLGCLVVTLISCECVNGVEISGTFKTSCATHRLLGDSISNSFRWNLLGAVMELVGGFLVLEVTVFALEPGNFYLTSDAMLLGEDVALLKLLERQSKSAINRTIHNGALTQMIFEHYTVTVLVIVDASLAVLNKVALDAMTVNNVPICVRILASFWTALCQLIELSYSHENSCLVFALICHHLTLGDYSSFLGLRLLDRHTCYSKEVSNGCANMMFVQELKIKVFSLDPSYGGDFSIFKGSMILAHYLDLLIMFGLQYVHTTLTGCIEYVASSYMIKVWDSGRKWRTHSCILKYGFALTVATSLSSDYSSNHLEISMPNREKMKKTSKDLLVYPCQSMIFVQEICWPIVLIARAQITSNTMSFADYLKLVLLGYCRTWVYNGARINTHSSILVVLSYKGDSENLDKILVLIVMNYIALLSAIIGSRDCGARFALIQTGAQCPLEIIGRSGDDHLLKELSAYSWSYKIGLDGLVNHLFAGNSHLFAYSVTKGMLVVEDLYDFSQDGNIWLVDTFDGVIRDIYLSHNKFTAMKLVMNLEDKVLIDGGSIVMNGLEGVLANGLIDRSMYQHQPKISLSVYIWDPGPSSYELKETRHFQQGIMQIVKMLRQSLCFSPPILSSSSSPFF